MSLCAILQYPKDKTAKFGYIFMSDFGHIIISDDTKDEMTNARAFPLS